MKKKCALLVMFFASVFIGKVNAQLHEIILWDKQDTWIKKESDQNFGHSWNLRVTGDGGESHAWIQWDLQSLLDFIPEGEDIVYAEVALNITPTWDPDNGFYAILLNDDVFDYWEEGIGGESTRDELYCSWTSDDLITTEGFNWAESELMNGKNPYNPIYHDTLYWEEDTPSKAGGARTFEVTNLVKAHMGDSSNKLITVRLTPVNVKNNHNYFLGFYSREAQWDGVTEDTLMGESCGISKNTPRIKAYYGENKRIFSDIAGFGDKSNYIAIPKNPFEFWVVDTIDGINDDRIIVKGRTGALPEISSGLDGLSAMLIFNRQIYDEFDVAFDAKLSKADFSNPGLIDPEDIAFVFDWVDENTYSCFLFHQVDTIGRFFKVKNGKRTLTDDVDFDFENSVAAPKYDGFHTYHITRTTTALSVSIDGVSMGFTANPEFLSGVGKIGIGTLNNQVYFDNFETWPRFPNNIRTAFSKQSIRLYPNPASTVLNVDSEFNIAQISVYNLVGTKVLEGKYLNEKSAQIDVSQLNSGVYFINVSNTENSKVAVSKFLKVK